MMNKTLLVIKTMVKMHYSKAGKNNTQIILFVLAAFFLLPFLMFYLDALKQAVQTIYQLLEPLGQSSIILGLLLLILTILLFIISFITIISAFYFAEDIESFIPFPLQPYQILLGKAAVPFIYLYTTTIAIYLPIMFYFGNFSSAGFLYYLFGLLLFFILPIIPFTIAAIFVMFVMRFVNIAKNKDRSKIIAGIALLSFIIGINVLVRLNTNQDAFLQNVAQFLQERDGLLQFITTFYPPALFGTRALLTNGLESLLFFLLFIGLSIGFFFLFIGAGQRFYLKGVLGVNTGHKKQVSSQQVLKKTTAKPVWITYIQKELRIIFRTPTFFIQCVIQSLFGPVFLFIILLMDSNTLSLSGIMTGLGHKQMILLLFIVTVFILSANVTAISSVSREGKNWHTNLFLPLDPKQIFFSKIAISWLINLITIVLFGIVLLAILDVSWIPFLLWLLLVLLASWFTSAVGTYLDFSQPKLNWTDEQEVFKARLIGLFALLFEFVPLGFIVLLLWNLPFINGLFVTFTILFLVLTGATFFIHYLLQKKLNDRDHQTIM
ncbi:ABC-2 type transport system permease protein [Oceanobacillus limi]|uniref:ABC-2 type transport system permease protein n=1 Tax=Oceanobacillus limi TaxID=930131 RepID=A0A1H9YI87_9BACI|nr:hypothetical protein [Oceanobacillus limi]SES68765.1 ABC-2 type transport system permease protein [Oceanobacillus limi]